MSKFMLQLILIAAIVTGLHFLAGQIGLSEYVHPLWWANVIFFFLISLGGHMIALFGMKLDEKSFPMVAMVLFGLRLLFSLVFIAIFLYRGVDSKVIFAADFFFVYLFFTGFDIYTLLTNLRPQSNGKK